MKNLRVLDKAEELSSNLQLGQDVILFGLQHLTPTNVELFKRLIKKGLRPENTYLMGKCYSANPINFHNLNRLGINMAESSFYFDSHRCYDEVLSENVRYFFSRAIKEIDFSKCKKVILLDDGAALLSEKSLVFPEHVEVVGIEQTSGGYNIAKNSNIEFPIINVARCEAKLTHETPFITRMVCRKVKEHMDQISFEVKNVLILGSGFIGRAVNKYLSPNFNVDMIDPRDSSYNLAEIEKNLSKYQLIVGCAGVNSITMEQLKNVRHPIALISASSSDREFPALELRQEIEPYHYFSQNIVVGNIHLINSGFPINFDDKFLDSEELELTRALIFLAVMQAASLSYPKKSCFENVENQDEIVEVYLETYKGIADDFSSFERSQKEISYPIVHKLLRGMTHDAFSNLREKVSNGFNIARTHFSPFELNT